MEQKFHPSSETEFLEDELDNSDVIEEDLEVGPNESRVLKVRLDKWLWAARFFKTRAVARAAVEKGKVFYNGERSKPSREIELGAMLQIRHGHLEKTVIIKGLSTRRRNQEEALQLFEETQESPVVPKTTAPMAHRTQAHNQQVFPFYPSHKIGHFSSPTEPSKERRSVRFLRRSTQGWRKLPQKNHEFDTLDS